MILYDIHAFFKKQNSLPLETLMEKINEFGVVYEGVLDFISKATGKNDLDPKFIGPEFLELLPASVTGTWYLKVDGHPEIKVLILNACDQGAMTVGIAVKPEDEEKYVKFFSEEFGEGNVFICYHLPPPNDVEEIKIILKGEA